MSLDSEVAALTRVTTQLLSEVNVTSSSLSDKATTASNEATSAAGRVPTAEGYKDQAFQYSSDAETLANNTRDAVSYSLLPEGVTDSIVTNDLADIFVYDTTKDSDGGAWRHRTQNTSWYDEADAPTGTWLGVHEDETSARLANLRTGPELVTNGTFEDSSGWYLDGFTIANGVLSKVSGTGNSKTALFPATIENGKTYEIAFNYTDTGANLKVGFATTTTSSSLGAGAITVPEGTGRKAIHLTATADGASFGFAGHHVYQGIVDNVSVKEITDYGSELVTNGAFATDSDWSISPAGSSEISGGVLFTDGVSSTVTQSSLGTEDNKLYVVEFDYTYQGTATSGTRAYVRLGEVSGQASINGAYPNQTKRFSRLMQAGSGNYLSLVPVTSSGETFTIDNVSVREVTLQTEVGDYYHNSSDYFFYKLNALGTSPTKVYRGSRKEFPSKAVIVADNASNYNVNSRVVIYDGDDPTLPMWMMFLGSWNYAAGTMLIIASGGASTPITSVAMLNGKLCVGSNHQTGTTSGLHVIDFLQDKARLHRNTPSYTAVTNHAGIVERNAGRGVPSAGDSALTISDARVNDIAMTVLPDAPIDDATGLPIPTIAVGVGEYGQSGGGTSIIRDDGTVVDIVNSTGAGGYQTIHIDFDQENRLVHTQSYNGGHPSIAIFDQLPDSDLPASNYYVSQFPYVRPYRHIDVPSLKGTLSGSPHLTAVAAVDNGVSFGFADKLTLLSENHSDLTKGMVNYIASTYNTGWLNGDIKGAFLSDTSTDTLGVSTTELVTNGTFTNNIDGWADGGIDGSSSEADNGTFKMYGNSFAYQGITTQAGVVYKLSVEITATTSTASQIRVGTTINGTDLLSSSGLSVGTHEFYFVATGTESVVTLKSNYVPGDLNSSTNFDNISIKESEEHVINGTFDTNTSGWTDGSSGTGSVSYQSGEALLTSVDTSNRGVIRQQISADANKLYAFSAQITSTTANSNYVRVGQNVGSADRLSFLSSGVGTYEGYFVGGTGGTVWIEVGGVFGAGTTTVDNISVKLADADRSHNNNGLVVKGNITRSPVATGAELVAYSGFSTNNYLEQPYNSDLDFGTGDFCIMGWGKTNINGTFLSRGDGFSAGSWYWRHLGSTTSPFYIHDGAAFRLALNVQLPKAEMVHFALLRRSGTIFLYGNGALMGSLSGAYPALSMTNTTARLRIGDQQHSSYSGAGEKQALLRISATAPTADQIKNIYEDERHLFKENAKCTLYGSSDGVTALEYDEDTDLLHVGTSGGRSSFSGLVRVDEKAGNITTAISASNGLIVED